MKLIKNRWLIVLSLLLVTFAVLAGCNDTTPSETDEVFTSDATDPVTDAVTRPDPETSDKLAYTITVLDVDGNPVAGVTVQMCVANGFCLLPAQTDTDGVAVYNQTQAKYYVTVVAVPDGFTVDAQEHHFAADATTLTIILAKVGEAPTEVPTEELTEAPAEVSTEEPTEELTEAPAEVPTEEPTEVPTEVPTEEPTEEPTEVPTEVPTEEPTEEPTEAPTEVPTEAPTEVPTEVPTEEPTEAPTEEPTEAPTEPAYGYEIGDPCYDATLPLFNEGTYTVREGKGKITVLNFWGTWCGPCKNEMPHFDRIATEYANDLRIVTIHSEYGSGSAEAYIAANFPDSNIIFAYDPGDSDYDRVARDSVYPITVILDENGIITHRIRGSISYTTLKNMIVNLLP